MIRLVAQGEGFTLFYKGRRLLAHSARSPALFLGLGQGRYTMSHGHFRIGDKLRKKTPCSSFRILESTENRALIDFPGQIRLSFEQQEGRLCCRFSHYAPDWNRLWIELCADSDEHIYGCGEQFSELDLRGKRLPIWSQEQGVGRGKDLITLLSNIQSGSGGTWYSSYFPMALFLSSKNWFCFCESSAYAEFDFRSRKAHRLLFWQIPEKLVFDKRETAPEIIESLSNLLGRQPALPDWTQEGVLLGVQGGSAVVLRKLQQAIEAGVKVAGLWVQDWEGRRQTSFGSQLMWNWSYDKNLYPDLPQLIEECHRRGIRFLGYINPFLAIERELYREVGAKGYCVKNSSGQDLLVTMTDFRAALLDLTNQEACAWIKGVIREKMLGIGLDGWMADYGEYLSPGSVLASGESWELVHNVYPLLWARTNWEAVAESGRQNELFFFMRAGYNGSSRYAPAFFSGDQLVNWSLNDGLATVIPSLISLGLQGIGHSHSDIGGFTTVAWIRRSKELFLRWAEMAAFTPLMRTHEGNRPEANWQFDSDPETLSFLARMTDLYHRLKGYRLHVLEEYRRTGLPPIRHPYLHYGSDPVLHTLKYQYLFGRDLLVAPVILKNCKNWKVYLPEEPWIHLWSGKRYAPGWRRVPAPLGAPPVFYRQDSPFKQSFQELRDPGFTV
ncbi:Sulfoquinovosidase [subsurface metagenome]